MKEYLFAWLLAVLVTAVTGSIIQSQFVLTGLEQVGVSISLSSRFYTTFNDLAGLLPGYGAVIALGLLPAFLLASWIRRKLVYRPVGVPAGWLCRDADDFCCNVSNF